MVVSCQITFTNPETIDWDNTGSLGIDITVTPTVSGDGFEGWAEDVAFGDMANIWSEYDYRGEINGQEPIEGWNTTWEPLTPVGQGINRTWTKPLPIPNSSDGDVLHLRVTANIYPTFSTTDNDLNLLVVPCTNEFTYTRPAPVSPPQPIFWYNNPICSGEEVVAYNWGAYFNTPLEEDGAGNLQGYDIRGILNTNGIGPPSAHGAGGGVGNYIFYYGSAFSSSPNWEVRHYYHEFDPGVQSTVIEVQVQKGFFDTFVAGGEWPNTNGEAAPYTITIQVGGLSASSSGALGIQEDCV